jgi:hypothetical protein
MGLTNGAVKKPRNGFFLHDWLPDLKAVIIYNHHMVSLLCPCRNDWAIMVRAGCATLRWNILQLWNDSLQFIWRTNPVCGNLDQIAIPYRMLNFSALSFRKFNQTPPTLVSVMNRYWSSSQSRNLRPKFSEMCEHFRLILARDAFPEGGKVIWKPFRHYLWIHCDFVQFHSGISVIRFQQEKCHLDGRKLNRENQHEKGSSRAGDSICFQRKATSHRNRRNESVHISKKSAD